MDNYLTKRCYSCEEWKPKSYRLWLFNDTPPVGLCKLKNKPKSAVQLCSDFTHSDKEHTMPIATQAPLSEQVKRLEDDLRVLSMKVLKTEQVVQSFVDCYDTPNPEHTMPKDRTVHTKELRNLLNYIDNA